MRKRVYTEEQKEKRRKQKREWYQKNKEKVSQYNKEYSKVYRETNKETLLDKKREYYSDEKNIKHKNEYMKLYSNTQFGRAANLVSSYRQMDKKTNVGETTITAQWIVEHIFPKVCVYCGESDWKKLGCDRIDNSKPHTEDNVVCCCGECNVKKGKTKSYEEFLNENKKRGLN